MRSLADDASTVSVSSDEDSVGERVGVGVSSSPDSSVSVSPSSVAHTGRISLDALWRLGPAKDSILV